MRARVLSLVIAGVATLFSLQASASAQSSNIETVAGPNTGEQTTLTISPHALTDDVSARALGVSGPNDSRWALTLIGVTPADSLGLRLSGQSLPIEEVTRPDEGEVGPTRLYISGETFLTIAETEGVELLIGDTRTGFPDQMRTEMQQIYKKVL